MRSRQLMRTPTLTLTPTLALTPTLTLTQSGGPRLRSRQRMLSNMGGARLALMLACCEVTGDVGERQGRCVARYTRAPPLALMLACCEVDELACISPVSPL